MTEIPIKIKNHEKVSLFHATPSLNLNEVRVKVNPTGRTDYRKLGMKAHAEPTDLIFFTRFHFVCLIFPIFALSAGFLLTKNQYWKNR